MLYAITLPSRGDEGRESVKKINKNFFLLFAFLLLTENAVSKVYTFNMEDYFFPLVLGIPRDMVNESIKIIEKNSSFTRKQILDKAYDDPLILFQHERFEMPNLTVRVKQIGLTKDGKIRTIIKVKNTGRGDAFGVVCKIETSRNIKLSANQIIYGFIPKNRTKSSFVDLDIKGNNGWIKVTPVEMSGKFKPTTAFVSRKLQTKIESYDIKFEKFFVNEGRRGFAFGNNDGRVDPGELIEIIAVVKNETDKSIKNILLFLSNTSKGVFMSKPFSFIDEIQPNETASAVFSIITPPNFSEPVMSFTLYTIQSGTLSMNRIGDIEITLSFPLVIQVVYSEESAKESLTEHLRRFRPRPRKAVAVLIGIENYLNYPSSKFSVKDATDISYAFVKSLGIPARNINVLLNMRASVEDIKEAFERWLVEKGEDYDEAFVFFSGYSATDPKTRELYIIPWDGDVERPRETGYPISKVLKILEKNFSKAYLMLDTDTSGRSRSGKKLEPIPSVNPFFPVRKGTSIFFLKGYDISIQETGHGILTTAFLKSLQENASVDLNKDSMLSLHELTRFMAREVQKLSAKVRRFSRFKHIFYGKNIYKEVFAEW